MPFAHADIFEQIISQIEPLQDEINELASQFSLTPQAETPAIELQVSFPHQATVEYILWGEAGLIVLRGKLPNVKDSGEASTSFPVTMRFSLSHELGEEVEDKKRRIEEIMDTEVDLFWSVPPVGHSDHVEVTLSFAYAPNTGQLHAYCACVLGMITGKVLAA
ncbi:hypothetical protein [Brevibacillus migulae]|uniref:hypothetical protein n=1 Tax=Brevibacillus migulae TaxID=1644114 RepID=UPI00106E3AF5|nr:hypothetical protein [Brevibacillus migulae]